MMEKELSPESKRRRNELIIIGVVSILILLLTAIEIKFPQVIGRIPVAKNIIIFSLININIILILLLIFLVIRNLVKLIFERRRKVLGAKLRTKLVVAFISLSLVPTILLFLVAAGFITNSVEHWFSAQVEQSLQGALEVAQTYYRDVANHLVSSAHQISQSISRQEAIKGEKGRSLLIEQLASKREEYRLSTLGLFFKEDGDSLRVEDPVLRSLALQPPKDLLDAGFSGKEAARILSVGEGEMIFGIAPLAHAPGGEIIGVVATSHFIPKSLSVKMREISHAFVEYRQLKILKKPIKSSYMMALLMVTLLIVFSATWFGFHLAKDITVPIKELAEATSRIATGDLNFRIPMKAADEIGMLVRSFNQMTEDLQVSRLELEQRKKYMEIILKNVAAGVISTDEKGMITTINTSAEQMLGIRGEEVIGKRLFEILAQAYLPQIEEELLAELRSSQKESIQRQVTVNLKGKSQTLLINLTNLKDEEGKSIGVVALFDDLTQMIKAQRVAAWREVARRIAHEIKNPLTPIQLSAQRLRKRYLEKLQEDGAVFDECTRTIVNQVGELKNLVNEFSNFARLPASNPTPNHLNEIVKETLVLFQDARKEVRFEFNPQDLPVFNIDREQMKRVLINLIKNSLAAVGREGEIRIRTSYDPRLQIVRLEVSDNGRGIPDEDKGKLFEPYYSTKKSGTGLGLTIVNTIVADHNGYIRVRDNLPSGTTFLIELPARV
ncbi:MAG TPA: ATP-binding protein [Thermodesulfobacteriota bacterium]|nr:ATP-binding protein [Thermodesulfobacteriota bacterium]